jgi:hypothetical protein
VLMIACFVDNFHAVHLILTEASEDLSFDINQRNRVRGVLGMCLNYFY